MATFLSLCNDVARESGTFGGQTLATVTGATGRGAKIVAWTRQAWQMIQREREDWTFRRAQFSHALTIGETLYTPADLGVTDFGGWERATERYQPFTLYDSALGRADETMLRFVAYRDWLNTYDRGAPDQVRPNVVSFTWGREVVVGPPPDKAYVLRGWYRRGVQNLTLDADEPYIDEDYHQAIVWRALMLLGDDDEAPFEVASSTNQYRQVHSAMLDAFLDPIEL